MGEFSLKSGLKIPAHTAEDRVLQVVLKTHNEINVTNESYDIVL